jgi:hypothetical protein
MNTNPFEPPSEYAQAPQEKPPGDPRLPRADFLEKKGAGAVSWQAVFAEDRLWLTPSDGRPVLILTHAELLERATISLGLVKAIVLKQLNDRKNLVLQLLPESQAALRAWIEPKYAQYLRAALKQRMRFSVVFGLLVLGTQFMAPEGSANILSFISGAGWLSLGLLTWLRPHAVLFVIDSVVWLVVATNNAKWAYETDSVWSTIFAVFCVFFAKGSYHLWQFYKEPAPEL